MIKLGFITIHPDFIQSYFSFGAYSQAEKKNLARFSVCNLRDFSIDRRGSVDDRPYGGGDGMIMRPEPLAAAIQSFGKPLVVLTSPQGKLWQQSSVKSLLSQGQTSPDGIVFICGRFGGIDQRLIERYVDVEISLGDFIISGGEVAALAIGDSMLRLIPGVLGHEDSAQIDSFSEGLTGRLEYAQYTRPEIFEGVSVPPDLLSGDHARIEKWRKNSSLDITQKKRPDLL